MVEETLSEGIDESVLPEGNGESVLPVGITDSVRLGGNIELSGFKEVDGGSMVILKKVIGTYARRFSEIVPGFESLSIHMKPVHVTEASKKFEVTAKVVGAGKHFNSSIVDRNLFVAVDIVLKKLQSEMG